MDYVETPKDISERIHDGSRQTKRVLSELFYWTILDSSYLVERGKNITCNMSKHIAKIYKYLKFIKLGPK